MILKPKNSDLARPQGSDEPVPDSQKVEGFAPNFGIYIPLSKGGAEMPFAATPLARRSRLVGAWGSAMRLTGLVGLLVCLVLVAVLLVPAGAEAQSGTQTPGPCDDGWVAPTPTVIAVTSVPITVSSTENDYFVLYVKHDRGSGKTLNVPVLVKRGESGTTTLSDSLTPLGADKYKVEKYLVASPADVDGDCVDDITELDDFGHRDPTNPAIPVAAQHGSVALEDRAAFGKLSYQGKEVLIDHWLKDLEYVKFTILNVYSDSPKLWFQDTERYRRHWTFDSTFRSIGLGEVVKCCWSGMARGVLIYHPNIVASDGSLGVYRWEFQPSDKFAFREVSIVHEILAAAMPFLKDNLAYYPFVGTIAKYKYEQEKSLYDASRVNILKDSDIRPDVEYVAYNKAEGYGLLGVFKPGESPGPRDVAILSVLPNDLPRAAGVITTVPQTPLSHVNLRAIQNGTPNAFIRDALTDETVTDLLGSYVYYRATADGYTLRAATKSEVDDHHAASRPKQTQTLQRDLTKTSITSLSNVSFADWTAFGVKAANVAELTKVSLPTGTAPVGYAVPFYFYDEFMKQATVSKETILGKKKAPAAEKITLPAGTTLASAVTQMLAHSKFQTDADIQEEMLDDLRKAIKDATSPTWITTALTAMHGNYPDGQSLRYRSSTNNEDLPDFNGAGLYDSKTQDPDETTDDGIDKSIKAVWASLWNDRAFLERDFHRVDHTTVAMGVLVHPNYSDEKVNGVAVSFDPVTGRDDYYYVNSQLGEDLVTNPEALSLPEEILLDPAGAATVLARSNLAPANQLLMTNAQMIYLRNSLKAIHNRFKTLYSPAEGEDFAVEIEFKITAQNKLAIKQARPWVFSQPLSACVPQLPTDAVTVDEVQGWRDANNNPDHVQRWNRVLAALGVDTGETKMTAAESKALETVYLKSRWERVTRTLAAIEICHPGTVKKPPVISIVAGSGVTEGDDAEFTMTASPVPAADLDVTVEVTQSGDFVTTGSQTVTIPTSGSFTLTVPTVNDSDDEADGSVTATVNSGAGYTVSAAAGSATVAVSDDDLPPVDVCVTALTGDGSVTGEWTDECDSVGRSGRSARFFTFSLDNQTVVKIDLESSWDTYLFLRGGLGRDSQKLYEDDDGGNGYNSRISKSLAAGDYTIEATTFGREKTGAFTLTVVGLPDQAPPVTEPEISIAAGTDITEGGDAVFTVSASPTPASDFDVTVVVSQSGDYASTGSQTVTISTTGSQTLTVTTTNDSTDEADGSVTATISSGTGYTVSSTASVATVAVSDDDDAATLPEISITADGDVTEGTDASYTLTATPKPAADLDVTVEVSQSGDFVTVGSQTVTITTSGTATLTVPTNGDSAKEPDGSVTATISSGTGYTVSTNAGSATVAVSDDDGGLLPPQSVIDSCVSDSVLTSVRRYYDVNKDRAPNYGRNWKRVLVTFRDVEDSQLTPFTAAEALAGEQQWFGWRPIREALECIESAVAPPPATPEISIVAGSGVTEGTDATFTISATPAPSADLDVTVEVSQSGDFGITTGAQTVSIPTGGTYTLTVSTSDDSADETDGSVTATLNSGTGYTVSTSNGAANVVVSDDDVPEISIVAGSGVTEGGTATFTITANPTPAAALSVSVSVSQSGDFGITTGAQTVSIPTGGTYTLTVSTSDDSADEADGSVTATVNTGTGYTVSTNAGSAMVAVSDDDGGLLPPQSVIDSCVSDSVLTTVHRYYDVNKDRAPNYGRNWKRVLVTFRDVEDSQLTPFTAAEALAGEQQWFGWRPIREALECIEAAVAPPPPSTPVISIVAGSSVTEGSDATFTITASPTPAAALSVSVTVSQSGDYAATTGTQTVTITTSGSYTLTVATTNDSTDEADGSVTATVDTGTGYTVSSSSGSATVAVSDDDVPEISIAAGSGITEGSDATFTITASPTPAAALSVSVSVSQSGDFGVTTGAQTISIPTTGGYTLTISTTNDSTDESDGSVTATVDTGTGYTVSSSNGSATVSVSDDDPTPLVVLAHSCVSDSLLATVRSYYEANTHRPPSYGANWKRVLIAFGDVQDGQLTPYTAAEAEQSEQIWSGWAPVREALVCIEAANQPSTPVISIAAGSGVTEGSDATFTITASPVPTADLDVSVMVSQSGDYAATTGTQTVTITTSGSYTLTISTTNDSTDEADGSVTATVDTGTGYTVSSSNGSATVAISDDDDPPPATPVISIAAGSGVTEGNDATFTVTASPAPTAALTVSVTVSQSGDFGATTGTQTVSIPTSGSYTLTVATTNDSTDEADGSITATVDTGTGYTVSSSNGSTTVAVSDDDDPPPATPVISIAAGSGVTEGSDATFTITASPTPTAALTVSVTVSQSGDYAATTGTQTVTIPTSGSYTLTVSTSDDSADESDGSVTATLNSGTGHTVSSGNGAATVMVSDNDDPAPLADVGISIAGASGQEGREVIFEVTLSKAVDHEVEVRWETQFDFDGNHPALDGMEFWTMSGWIVFAPGETSQWEEVYLNDDQYPEPDETFIVELSDPEGGSIDQGRATMTITDDD